MSEYSLYGKKISETYPRVLQITSGNTVLDGSGDTRSLQISGSLSADTLFSGATNLYDIFATIGSGGGSGTTTNISNGLNTYTGGTTSSPTINVSALTINTIIASGDSSFSTLTATTISATTLSATSIFVNEGTSLIELGEAAPGVGAVWLHSSAHTTTNPTIASDNTNTFIRSINSNGSIIFRNVNTTKFNISSDLTTSLIPFSSSTISGDSIYTTNFSAFSNSISGVSFLNISGGTPILNINTLNGRVGINNPAGTNTLDVGGNINVRSSIVSTLVGGYYINGNIALQQGPAGYSSSAFVFGNPSTAAASTVFTPAPVGIATSGSTLRNIFTISQSTTCYGTVASTSGSSILTGTSTSFLTVFNPGDIIRIGGGLNYIVSAITSDTLLTTTVVVTATTSSTAFTFPVGAGERFTIGSNGNVKSISNSVSGFTIYNRTGETPVFTVDTNNFITTTTSFSGGTISGGTIFSGGTDLNSIFVVPSSIPYIQNGLNTYTGGTSTLPSVNVSALTINTLTTSGETTFFQASATTLSATSIFINDGTSLMEIGEAATGVGALWLHSSAHTTTNPTIASDNTNTFIRAINTNGSIILRVVNTTKAIIDTNTASFVVPITATTISANTIYSGSTNLENIFLRKSGYLLQKAGTVTGSTFVGSPRTATVTFTSNFPSSSYAVAISSDTNRTWTVESQTLSGFTINSNSSTAFNSGNTYWTATEIGEGYR